MKIVGLCISFPSQGPGYEIQRTQCFHSHNLFACVMRLLGVGAFCHGRILATKPGSGGAGSDGYSAPADGAIVASAGS